MCTSLSTAFPRRSKLRPHGTLRAKPISPREGAGAALCGRDTVSVLPPTLGVGMYLRPLQDNARSGQCRGITTRTNIHGDWLCVLPNLAEDVRFGSTRVVPSHQSVERMMVSRQQSVLSQHRTAYRRPLMFCGARICDEWHLSGLGTGTCSSFRNPSAPRDNRTRPLSGIVNWNGRAKQ